MTRVQGVVGESALVQVGQDRRARLGPQQRLAVVHQGVAPREGTAALGDRNAHGVLDAAVGIAFIMVVNKDATFVDVACGVGAHATDTYAVASTGILCAFGTTRLMERWVQLAESSSRKWR